MKHALLRVLVVLILFLGCSNDKSTKPTGDTTPPGMVQNLIVTSPAGRLVTLSWSAPGDNGMDGQAARYEIRYSATPLTDESWDSASVVASPPIPKGAGQLERFSMSGLPIGTWQFALKACDEVPNWSAMSNAVIATVADLLAPDQVTNLNVSGRSLHSVTLLWTAPGNDGAVGRATAYDLRYALATITEEIWDDAGSVADVPAPMSPGAEESFTVDGLESGRTYFFALKTADEVPNWSELSNVTSAVTEDVEPPGQVADLAVVLADSQSVTLNWTAPGNDGSRGRAVEYDLRYGTTLITDGTWDTAQPVQGVPVPDSAGASQSSTLTGLEVGQTYYFALKTADEVPQWSALSNVASVTLTRYALRRLTTSPGSGYGAQAPTWSPDGENISFSAGWSGNSEIYRIPAAGGSVVQLTNDPGYDGYPAWSPDGQKIAFVSDRGGKGKLWIMNATDGSQQVIRASHAKDVTQSCSWSPDGSQIAYHVGRAEVNFISTSIYFIPSSGGTPELFEGGGEYNNLEPAWSPDGTRIAFCSSRTMRWEVWIKTIAGGMTGQLTYDGNYAGHPTWAPDGRRIAYATLREGGFEIWTVSSTGGPAAQLTAGSSWDAHPAWSPDGKQIAFSSNRTGRGEIWILQLE